VFNDAITVKTYGNAGQSYGAFNTNGLKLEHTGILQDGVGKSATGGEIVVKTPKAEGYKAHENVVIGNACFFGAGSVKGYIEGQAGDRFCVRGSGMDVVVEGVGDFAGEYAGQGCIFNLGKAGKEIGVGSSGLIFMQYDPENNFKVSKDMKVINLAEDEGMKDVIKQKLQEHISRTGSEKALGALDLLEKNPEKAGEVFKIAISNELLKDRNLRGINDIKKVLSAMGNINPALTSQVLKMTYSKTEEAMGI
jgi:glutamate synthase (NADPH/NADH) large chain